MPFSLVWSLLPLAAPQEGADPAPTLDLQVVLVAPTERDPSDPPTISDRFEREVLAQLAPDRVPLSIDEVEAFGVDADLDPRTYLLACPPGRYLECAFVVGQRASADHVVTATQPLDDPSGLELAILDVAAASIRFVLPIDPAREDLGTYVSALLEAVIAGEVDPIDLRLEAGAEVDPNERSAAALLAAREELASLDESTPDRGDRQRGRAQRLRSADLRPYRQRDVPTPWEEVSLPADSWRRWRNSGKPLAWWRARVQGRQAELSVGLTLLGLAQGPWTQRYEAWYSIDPVSLRREDTWVLQDQQRGLLRSWEAHLGIGVLPWLELAGYGGPRVHTFRYRVQRIVPGNDPLINPLADRPVTTWHVGGRALFAPFPTWPARPTLGAGVEMWWAEDRARVLAVPEGIPDLPRNRLLLAVLQPGVEVDVSTVLRVFARIDLGIPVGGRVGQTYLSGGGNLPSDRPGPSTEADSLSFGASVGATARIRMAGRRWSRSSVR